MKLNTQFFFILTLVAGLLVGCKYDQGPIASLQSRINRISGDWEVSYATDREGEENTEAYEDWTLSFREDYSAQIEIDAGQINFEIVGTWDLSQNDEVFQLEDMEYPSGLLSFDEEYDIERLTRDEFWLRDRTDSMSVIQLRIVEGE